MDSLEFISALIGLYHGKDKTAKRQYKKDLAVFVAKCKEDKLAEVYEYALTLTYKNIDMLFTFASENKALKGQNLAPVEWTCDHGGVGTPAIVFGFQCKLCGDRRQKGVN